MRACSTENRSQVLHQEKKMVRIDRTRLEVMRLVPRSSLVILRVNQEGPDAGDVGSAVSPRESILEKGSTQSSTLFPYVDRKTGQEHYRDRVPWQALADPKRRLGMFDAARGQAVIPHDPAAPAHDVGARAASLLIDEGEPLQEMIQRRLSALERVDEVMRRKRLDRREGRRHVTQARSSRPSIWPSGAFPRPAGRAQPETPAIARHRAETGAGSPACPLQR